ncbi:aldehyde ferredoxin oxidoreductase N-terminal domain-containing protein [Acidaminobacter hydrogenoformans]|uniref:Aldehyde:ferredoxin oxidoreductase n=1 Tax=Acidaminobacter hydrogenoformans DSM 2784 TaxID=1120920 RepID=A0A1G5RU14_9FIRM|nr:aldehyde ferredoxin oxidoreductase N-terminal domain-containing protein [Acidaminobacter hydrogenoformans]SCZ77348.1 aldehyde:ferredoxin oxidoreductase [Acidaminobacter hydrogenoformans DSM 2784]
MIYQDYIKVLTIDLTEETYVVSQRKDLKAYLGGVGIASKLLEEHLQEDKAPLDPEQCVVFAIGALSTIFPIVTKTVAMFWSPLTGELGESYAGGRMALTMFMARYDAIIIKGRAKKPIYLSISSHSVEFKDAAAMWGLESDEVGRIIREREPGAGKRSILRIGPAGENLVHYASVCVDTYRHFGRLGLGAVLGSKNLKAICIYGKGGQEIKDRKAYFKTFTDIHQKALNTDLMKKYHDLGTPIGVSGMNEFKGIPTLNLQTTFSEDIEPLTGEAFAQRNLIRKTACAGCPVGCIHIGQFRREFGPGYEYEAVSVSYDYELIFSLGTFLGIKTSDEVLEMIEAVETYGLDAISAGVVLGWATEAFQKGLVDESQTLVPLTFGNQKNYLKALKHISDRTNDFYRALGDGSAAAAKLYGGEDFAMQLAGNEMAGYHTGYGSVLGAAVGARHSHLCNGGYGFDQAEDFSLDTLVDKVFEEELHRCLLNSMIACLFGRRLYDRGTIVNALASIGETHTEESLKAAAVEIYKTKLRLKSRFGFDQLNLQLPKRFFETPGGSTKLEPEVLAGLMRDYAAKCDALFTSKD